MLAVETADPLRLAAFDPEGQAPVLISAGRAATLKLTNQLEAADPDAAVLVERALGRLLPPRPRWPIRSSTSPPR